VGFEVREDMICGPEGEVTYSVLEDYTEQAQFNHTEKETTDGWTNDRTMRQALRVPARLYYLWERRLPGCWKDKNFIKSFAMEHPEYATCDTGRL